MEATPNTPFVVPSWQRQLLPGDAVDAGGQSRRSIRDWVVDAIIIGFALLAGLGALSGLGHDVGLGTKVFQGALWLAACALLWWRRRAPVWVAVAVMALSVPGLGAAGAVFVVVFNAAIRAPVRAIIWISLLSVPAVGIAPRFYYSGSHWSDLAAAVVLVVVCVGWGLFARAQRDLVSALHVQAEYNERDRLAADARVRDAERRRIAREMHDVLGHRISMVSLHAGALEHRGDDATDMEVAEVARVVRTNAATAMEELRGIIGVLRADEHGAVIEPPQPTLASIPLLLEEHRAAGLTVEANLATPPSDGTRAATELAAYRVVQEGMTNASRHAPRSATRVDVGLHDTELVVVVSSAQVDTEPAAAIGGGGAGLIGLVERLDLLGGRLEHGMDGGDFVLTATLPWGVR